MGRWPACPELGRELWAAEAPRTEEHTHLLLCTNVAYCQAPPRVESGQPVYQEGGGEEMVQSRAEP